MNFKVQRNWANRSNFIICLSFHQYFQVLHMKHLFSTFGVVESNSRTEVRSKLMMQIILVQSFCSVFTQTFLGGFVLN